MSNASRPNWKTYRFDQMATEIKDRVEVPRESGFERYVGLKHLDSGSLKIWRWGSTEDVEKQKMLFKCGDIIFGRRNAYLRRVSVADFDGVCSAHAMVLRARPDVALPEFLPFFMQTEAFWQAALRNSAGSLSPTINWPNIAKEEFSLPPLEEQQRIAEALTSTVKLSEKLSLCEASSRRLLKSSIEAEVERLAGHTIRLGDLVDRGVIAPPQDGNHGEIHPKAADYVAEGIPFLMAADVRDGMVDLVRCKFISEDQARALRVGFAHEGDVLLTHKGTVGETAILPRLDHPFAMLTPQVTYYRVEDDSQLHSRYLYFVFQSGSFYRQMLSRGRQSTRLFVGITKQLELEIPFPKIAVQRRLVEQWSRIESSAHEFVERRAVANAIGSSLRNSVFPAGGTR